VTNKEIMELAIDQALKRVPRIGADVAMRSEEIIHKLVEIRGDVAVVESVDGQLKEWPLADTFDVNLCSRIALDTTRLLN